MRRHSNTRTTALVGFAGLNLLDVISTWIGLQLGFAEANTIPALLLEGGGQMGMYLFKALVTLLVMAIVVQLSPRYERLWYAIYLGSAVLALVVLLNVVQILTA